MKLLLLLLPLAACGPHVDPCLRPCNPLIEECRCVEMDRDSRGGDTAVRPADPDVGGDAGPRPPDTNGDVSGDSSDDNGGKSDD